MMRRQHERDGAAHRVTAHRDATDAEGGDEIDQRLGESLVPVRVAAGRRLLALSEAGEVGDDDPQTPGEERESVLPDGSAPQISVDDEERRAATPFVEPNARPTRADVARSEG